MATPDETPETPDLTDTTTDAPAADAPADTDPFDSGSDTFDRSYVEKLRQESANYRTRAKEYEPYAELLGQYTDEDRAVWQEAMRKVAEDPRQGGEYLRQIADALLAEQLEEREAEGEDRPLTIAEFNRMQAEAAAKAEEQANIERIEKQAAELGYDVSSHHYTTLLTVASRLPSGSIEEAHAVLEAEKQALRDKIIAELQAEAEDSPAAPNPGSGAAPTTERQLRTWQDAEMASKARLEAAQVGDTSRRRR